MESILRNAPPEGSEDLRSNLRDFGQYLGMFSALS